ncbi:MAG: hydrogenase/urease maturation nickel metallochaperone HypA [Candidatus Margulisiibacteriota bacterium]
MHELSMVQDLLAAALKAAGGKPIKVVRIKVGEHCHAAPDNVEFLFKTAAHDSPAANAKVEVTIVPGEDLLLDSIQVVS